MLLADENIPLRTIRHLRERGFDVLAVAETAPGLPDAEVLGRAAAEARILLTFDRDYGGLIFKHGHPPPRAVIYFRSYPVSIAELNALVEWFLNGGAGALDGHLVVWSRDGVRKRAFPHRTG